MALIITPKDTPESLLNHIKSTMKGKAISTWAMDADGDFTHSPPQWLNKAWFRPKIAGSQLVFIFLGNTSVVTTITLYAVYHGRFLEMLLAHFDTQFSEAEATALPAKGDLITKKKT